jgi:predicted acetyltransferase
VIEIRTATEADWPEMFAHDVRAFGSPFEAEAMDLIRPTIDLDRFVVARDTEDGSLAGVAGSFALTLTVPGGAQLEAPGVTWVSVAPSHRRLGVLRSMLDELHARYAAAGAAVAILTASEGTIYERFGYGTATFVDEVTIDRRSARLRTPLPGPTRTRGMDAEAAKDRIEELYRRWHAATPGSASADQFWELFHADPEWNRWGGTARRYLIHPDGFVTYRVDEKDRAQLDDVKALTDAATADLWQTVLGLDIFDEVTADLTSDHPLREMLIDSRSVKVTARKDRLWLKFIDVPAALTARTYQRDADLVLGVDGVAYRLRISGGVAQCTPTDERPSVSLSGPTLAGLYLGATSADTLARAGRIDGDFRALAILQTERQPELGTSF